MKTIKGRITERTSGNRGYKSTWLYIPSKISKDTSFPFKNQEEVILELKGNQLIVKKSFTLSDLTKNYGIQDATLSDLVEGKAEFNQDKTFLKYQNKNYTYNETNEISNQIANALLDLFQKLKRRNPKIAILMSNCPQAIFCWFGITKTGAISVPISFMFKGELLEFVLKNSDSEILFVDYNFYMNYKTILDNLPKIKKIIIRNAPKEFSFNEKYLDYQKFLSINKKNPNIDINNSQPLEILYSSGTTGKPKGVIYRNHHTLSGISVGAKLEEIGFNKDNHKIYCPLPLFQAFARYLIIIPAMYYDTTVIISERFDISKFWEDIKLYEPTGFCYFGAYLSDLMNQEPKTGDRNHPLKYAFGFGAFKKIWEAFERRFGIQIIEAWSLVESVGLTINTIGSKGGKTGSVGVPVRGYELKIEDREGKQMRPGRFNVGEIVSRLKLPIELEYYNLEANTGAYSTKNRWVHTKDYGYRDKDGFLYFLGRESDMIQKGDDVFFALDIEIVANAHPLVINSAVFEVPLKNEDDAALKICVLLKEDTSLSYSEFHSYLKENLAYFMVPRFIEFKRELPKNANEIIQKFLLKKEWETNKIRRKTYDVKFNQFFS